MKTASPTTNGLRFRILKSDEQLSENDLLLADDVYVAVSKTSYKINRVTDFKNITLGVFTDDVGEISYYLKTGSNITYKPYDTISALMGALDDGSVNMIIIHNIMLIHITTIYLITIFLIIILMIKPKLICYLKIMFMVMFQMHHMR